MRCHIVLAVLASTVATWATRADAQSPNTSADYYETHGCSACAVYARSGDYERAAELFRNKTVDEERTAHEQPTGKENTECEQKVLLATLLGREEERHRYEAKLDQAQQDDDKRLDQAEQNYAARLRQTEQLYEAKLARLRKHVRAQCPTCDVDKL
jgi:hypothetical protein